MLKTRKRWISLLLTLAMLVAFCVPFVGPAAASTGLSALSVPTVTDDEEEALGTAAITIDVPEALKAGHTVVLSLPSGFKFGTVVKNTYNTGDDTVVAVPAKYAGDVNALAAADVKFTKIRDNIIKLEMNNAPSVEDGVVAVVLLYMNSVYVDEGFDGDIKLNAEAPSGSGFPSGDVVVGRVSGGAVTVAAVDTMTANDNFTVTFRVKESLKGSISEDNESLKFTLPDGFEWDTSNEGTLSSNDGYDLIWGDEDFASNVTIEVDKDELTLNVPKGASTGKATCFEFSATFFVTDEDKVKDGDIEAKVGGDSDATPTTLTVGTYGDYNATIAADADIPTIFAGKADQTIVDLVVKEGIEGSLINNRTLLLKLPENAKWDVNSFDTDYSDNSVTLHFAGLQNSDRTAKFTVTDAPSSGAAEIKLDDIQVITEAGYDGDLTVTVSGSAGIAAKDDELVVAKVVKPVTATVSSVKDVKLGVASQAIGDLIITENAAGALAEDGDLVIEAPAGVEFSSVPTVTVTDGDIDLGNITKSDDKLTIAIDNNSDTASTIKISGITVDLYRTIPEGDVTFKVKGDAVIDDITVEDDYWPSATTAAKVVAAKCVTPADTTTTGTAVFKIGEAKYTLNGAEITMDAAPYIKDGRTMVPVRFAANAVGVADSNIIWDAASKKVTVIKGDRVVQMTIGSNVMLINGASIVMDTAPEITSDRTMLPVRFLGQALGADFVWDEATQTVTVNF